MAINRLKNLKITSKLSNKKLVGIQRMNNPLGEHLGQPNKRNTDNRLSLKISKV